MLLAFTKISFHVWPLPRSPGVCDIKTCMYYILYARLLLPCLGWGSVLCSYEQSKCNPEAGSRLLHPLARELPLLPGLRSSPSDTARSDCIRETLKYWVFQKHKTLAFFPKHFPGYCSFGGTRGTRAWVAGHASPSCSWDHLLCLWTTNLYLNCWSNSYHNAH